MTFRRESFALPKPIAEDYSLPSGSVCVTVQVPDSLEHIALLQGLCAALTTPDRWQDEDEDIRRTYAKLWNDAYVATDWSDCMSLVSMVAGDLYAANADVSSGAKTYNASTSLPFGYAISTDNGITGVSIKNTVWLRAGSYRYSGWHSLTTLGGTCELVVTLDNGTTEYVIKSAINQSGTFGTRVNQVDTFNISTDGFYEFRARNTAAVSGNRQVNWISHHFWQLS